MYGGAVELIFDTLRHQYSFNGEVVKGCTSVLDTLNKPALVPWCAKVTVESMREQFEAGRSYDEIEIEEMLDLAKRANYLKKTSAGSIGTLSHDFAEAYAKKLNPTYPINTESRGACQRFVKWVEDNKVEFLLSEQPVFSLQNKFAGTLDAICRIDGKLYLIDYKTSSGIWETYYLQVGAYALARTEEFETDVFDGAKIIRFGKNDGDFEMADISKVELDFYGETFLRVLDVNRRMDKVGKLTKK